MRAKEGGITQVKIIKTFVLDIISSQVVGDGPSFLFTTDTEVPYRILYINPDDILPPYFVHVGVMMKENGMTPFRKYRGDIYYGEVKNGVFYAVTKMVR